jgi:hypothetical protein
MNGVCCTRFRRRTTCLRIRYSEICDGSRMFEFPAFLHVSLCAGLTDADIPKRRRLLTLHTA